MLMQSCALGDALLHASCATYPMRALRVARRAPATHRTTASARSCTAWGLPCHTCHHVCGALLPHHFTLTTSCCGMKWRCCFCGTFRRRCIG